jgi:lactosylceramide 4-alpha-galactosyltransferase
MASLCNWVGVHFRKILSLNSKRFRLGYFVITCFFIYWTYSAIVSNQQVMSVWLNFIQTRKFDPLMASNRKINRRTCCQSPDYSKDICGRPNCTSSCPSPRDLNQLKSDGPNAFFIETSGSGGLNIRQAFAVESLAFHNPNLTVNVLFMDDGRKKQIKNKIKTVEKLKSKYENIQFIAVDLNEFMAGTSMEKWFHCTDWRTGPYHVSHLSDGLRFLTLHKYGGYYFDLDVIFVRPVTYYRNFITAASATNFASGIIHADYGHPITQLTVNDFPTNYK